MISKDKYYGTSVMLFGNMLIKLREKGAKPNERQFRIVCKAKSMAEANRIAESLGFKKNCFKKKLYQHYRKRNRSRITRQIRLYYLIKRH